MISRFNEKFYKSGLVDDGVDYISSIVIGGGVGTLKSEKLYYEISKLTKIYSGNSKLNQGINIPTGCKILYHRPNGIR